MRAFRTAVVAGVVLVWVLLSGAPALAGNWAVTSLDPLPDRIEANRTYTVGFWVLQHGFHPYSGTLDPVGLKLSDGAGTTLVFPGTALREPAHYATAVLVPKAGTWQVFGIQGRFEDYLVGTLTVPGGLAVLPVPAAVQADPSSQPWGAIRPPQVPTDPNRDPFAQQDQEQPAALDVAAPVAARNASGGIPTGWVAGAAALLGGVVFLLAGRTVRRRQQHETGPRQELIG